jgi:hypothetical protein
MGAQVEAAPKADWSHSVWSALFALALATVFGGAVLAKTAGAERVCRTASVGQLISGVACAVDNSAYAAFRPTGSDSPSPGIPPVSAQPADADGWKFEGWGSPGAVYAVTRENERVASIAMSRNGVEGWAVASAEASGTQTLYHFDATAWQHCGPNAPGDNVPLPDEACAGLAGLRARGLMLSSITAVDLSSDRFEAIAVGWIPSQGTEQVAAVILRYRNARWTVEDAPSDPVAHRAYMLRSVAFTGPDDGWAYGQAALDAGDVVMLHFSQGRWVVCDGSRVCGGKGNVLPSRNYLAPAAGPVLMAAGDRVFLAGTRVVRGRLPTTSYFPVILSHRPGGPWEAVDGLDPAGPGKAPDPTQQGRITSFAVAEGDGGVQGWAREGPADGSASDTTLRLEPGKGWRAWAPTVRGDALGDHPSGAEVGAMVRREDGGVQAFMSSSDGPFMRFDTAEGRWRVLAAPFDPTGANALAAANFQTMAPDGRGGLWLVHDRPGNGPFFDRYTDRPHRPVFDDVPQPFQGGRIRDLAAADDGTVWLAGDGGALGRYDRLTGWSTLRVSGWNSGAVTALALGPDGSGVAVGEGGRVAEFGPDGARSGTASRLMCGARRGSCATGETLRAVDIAADGSALAGGDRAALVWRSAQGAFRAIRGPPIDPDTGITGLALPDSDRAWVATSKGQVFAGRRSGDDWAWDANPENVGPDGKPLSLEEAGDGVRGLRAIALSPDGRGYAVGDGGLVLERTGDTGQPWKRVELGVSDDFTAVALPRGGGDGALIGGKTGVIWTRADGKLQLARPASDVDGYAGGGTTAVSGLALVPGDDAGQTEAWAALDGPVLGGALLHYSSHPGDPLLTPSKPVDPLPDAPAPRPNELSFVAFGKSDCANPSVDPCPGASGTDALSDVISRRIVEAVDAESRKAGGPRFAIFTGDANDHGGDVANVSRPALLNEWVDLVARPLDEAKVPVLGAIGVLDLSEAGRCVERNLGVCVSSEQVTHAGANFFWRQAMVDRVGQDGGPERFGGLRYQPVTDDVVSPTQDVSSVPTGGARTHYAVDVVRGDQTLARLVFVDNSLGSLRASDPLQQPPEPRGQRAWLDRMLSSRPKGARAVVVSTSPSYSYEPSTVVDAADDSSSFERTILDNRVSAVVSGRVGWNSLYYTLAPGLHCPAPGGDYPDRPPSGPEDCGRASGPHVDVTGTDGLGPAVPFAIASSAGGKLAQESGDGYWHGYSVVRLDASGDPAKTIVEQRPIFDWLVITASNRSLRPGEKTTLQGVGREPPAADTPPSFHRLTDPSITHRYDLVVADPDQPWLPYRDANGDYVQLSERYPGCSVGCVDRQSGDVRAGDGTDHRVYAVGLLSAGTQAATYPLVFESRGAPQTPAQARAAAVRGLPRPGAQAEAPTQAPRSGPPSQGGSPSPGPDTPFSPGVTTPPLLDAPVDRLPGPPAPPALPSAPVAPASKLGPTASALPDIPRVSPVPPKAPPAKPAPKVLASREARQAQAASAPIDDPAPEAADESELREPVWVDLADAPSMPPGAATTRREPRRPDLPMTAIRSDHQPSAWVRGALYGGGLTLAAFILASGWLLVRPSRRSHATAVVTAATSQTRPWHGR